MSCPKQIALVGIGGFSRQHYKRIKELEKEGLVQLSAVMIRESSLPRYLEAADALQKDGVRIHTAYEEMLEEEKGRCDVVVLPVGISDHCEMSIAALEAGYHVICEKPVAGTVEECLRMEEARQKSGRILAICFQNIYSPLIQKIKQTALEGRLGALRSAKAYILWARADAYYDRAWGGRLVFNRKTINDCPLMNATAHYLNNMLYVAGRSLHEAAFPKKIYGENYRVKKIESCDTQFLRVLTDTDVELFFASTHATQERVDPIMEYSFEHGKITWRFNEQVVVSRKTETGYEEIDRFDGGSNEDFFRMIYRETCAAIDSGTQPFAVVQNSWQHVLCVEKSLQSGPIVTVPEQYIDSIDIVEDDDCLKVGDVNRVIKGIKPLMERMYADGLSFYEAGCPWAVPSETVMADSSGRMDDSRSPVSECV